jgi:hypothetical protein
MHQASDNKQLFMALITDKADNSYQELQFESKDRERIELALISEGTVNIDLDTEYEMPPLPQKSSTIPYLATSGSLDRDVRIIAKPIYDEVSASFNDKAPAGDSYYDGDVDNYVIPILWELYNLDLIKARNEDVYPNQDIGGEKIGTVFGQLILTSQIIQDGWDPVAICDDVSEDLRYVMSVMTAPSGPLYHCSALSDENVLYIHEIEMEPDYETPELKSRVIRELPWLCMKFMHIRPGIITYWISDLISEANQKKASVPYMQSGFAIIGESNVIYAYTV